MYVGGGGGKAGNTSSGSHSLLSPCEAQWLCSRTVRRFVQLHGSLCGWLAGWFGAYIGGPSPAPARACSSCIRLAHCSSYLLRDLTDIKITPPAAAKDKGESGAKGSKDKAVKVDAPAGVCAVTPDAPAADNPTAAVTATAPVNGSAVETGAERKKEGEEAAGEPGVDKETELQAVNEEEQGGQQAAAGTGDDPARERDVHDVAAPGDNGVEQQLQQQQQEPGTPAGDAAAAADDEYIAISSGGKAPNDDQPEDGGSGAVVDCEPAELVDAAAATENIAP